MWHLKRNDHLIKSFDSYDLIHDYIAAHIMNTNGLTVWHNNELIEEV